MTKASNGEDTRTVKQRREAIGYSLDDLAETCGLTLAEVTAIEDGRETDAGKLARVRTALEGAIKK